VRWILAWALLVGGASPSAEPASQLASTSSLDLTSYAAELDRLAAFLDGASEREAFELRRSVPDRWQITIDSTNYNVSTRWLTSELPADPSPTSDWPLRRTRLRARLTTLSGEAEALSRVQPGLRFAAARAALDEVLQRREFQQPAAATWRRRVEEWIRDLLVRLAENLGLSPRTGRWAAVTLAWTAGLAALAGLIVWLARMLTEQHQSVRLGLGGPAEPHVSAREWAERWSRAIEAGDMREAVRCAYRACLRRLEDQGALRVDPARTAREYLRLLPPRYDRRDTVADLTLQFERVWYGSQPLTPDEANRVHAHLETLGCLPVSERAI
jgi:uncharacterized protein DUF4129